MGAANGSEVSMAASLTHSGAVVPRWRFAKMPPATLPRHPGSRRLLIHAHHNPGIPPPATPVAVCHQAVRSTAQDRPEVWSALEQSLILTPSSYGMQPWKFVVLSRDAELRERLVPHSWGQRQVADASHFVVFTVRTEVTSADVDTYVGRIAEVRQIDKSAVDPLKKMIDGGIVKGLNASQQHEWAIRQAYIALGNFMTSAALLGVDTCPMEGIVPASMTKFSD